MSIIGNPQIGQVGLVDVLPETVYLNTNDTYATVTAAGYINEELLPQETNQFSNNQFAYVITSDFGIQRFNVSVSPSGIISLNPVTVPLAAGTIQYATASMTLAQWTGMSATPVLILPAQGTGILTNIHRVVLIMEAGSAFSGGGAVVFTYGNGALATGLFASNSQQAADFTGFTVARNYFFNGTSGNSTGGPLQPNTAIYISNTAAAFTGGTGRSMTIKLWYSAIPIP